MNSYSEVRRVRAAMSEAVGHDVRGLIAKINERRPRSAERIIDPGTEAEQCDVAQPPAAGSVSAAARSATGPSDAVRPSG